MSPDHRVADRAEQLFTAQYDANTRRTDRMFACLMVGQWIFGLIIAFTYSPYGWSGKVQSIHAHVYIALFLGGAITALPVVLAVKRPGELNTRVVIACAQMLWSALLIHLTGGRIETHFHVFGSLAFIAFYRDWHLLLPATMIVTVDHLARQVLWPESVYGITNPENWRFLEHAFWVVFEDAVLVFYCQRSIEEMRTVAQKRAEVEMLSESEAEKSRELDRALQQVKSSQAIIVRTEKLAAVGQLAASVGHELRNPLAAVANASAFVTRRLKEGNTSDPRVGQFLELIDREVAVCSRIISDLLDFARERPTTFAPCPLKPLVDEAIAVVPQNGKVKILNEVPDMLPVLDLDREQFRQILVNLVQNAVEAIPSDREGKVVLRAEANDEAIVQLVIEDNGVGISREVASQIFEPLFTTKAKGTGLGLAIVSNIVKRHNASIRVESEVGRGSRFLIDIPPQGTAQEAR